MAIYHMSVKVHGRAGGKTAPALAAYRAGARVTDERLALTHDYTRKGGVSHSEIMAPANVPEWMRDRQQLWNAVEAVEKRKDAQVAREFEISIPRELTREQGIAAVQGFARDELVSRGMIADINVHEPKASDGEKQPHAHILVTTRELTAEGFGGKAREWNDKALLEHWRATWSAHANKALEQAGRSERIDHRTLDAQRIEAVNRGDQRAANALDREPQPKLGRAARMEARGVQTERGKRLRQAQDRNPTRAMARQQIERELRQVEAEIIDLAAVRQARRQVPAEPSRPATAPQAAAEPSQARQAAPSRPPAALDAEAAFQAAEQRAKARYEQEKAARGRTSAGSTPGGQVDLRAALDRVHRITNQRKQATALHSQVEQAQQKWDRIAEHDRAVKKASSEVSKTLETIYRNRPKARALFEKAAAKYGSDKAAAMLRDKPEAFGELKGRSMLLGLVKTGARKASLDVAENASQWMASTHKQAGGQIVDDKQREVAKRELDAARQQQKAFYAGRGDDDMKSARADLVKAAKGLPKDQWDSLAQRDRDAITKARPAPTQTRGRGGPTR